MTKNILVIAAHPDDEILGCGGTLIKYQKKGYRVKVIFISDGDLNIDHRIVHQATMTACRPYKFKCVKTIYSFEIPSSTEANFTEKKKFFNPNYFFDVEKEIKKKIDVLKVYKQELEKWPHPRSLKNVKLLANYRGSQSGLKYAEAFNLLRKIK